MENEAPHILLREIEDRDVDVLFEHATDREAIRMAAFTSVDFDDRDAFRARRARIRRDPTTTNRVIEMDGRAVGHIASFDLDGKRRDVDELTFFCWRLRSPRCHRAMRAAQPSRTHPQPGRAPRCSCCRDR